MVVVVSLYELVRQTRLYYSLENLLNIVVDAGTEILLVLMIEMCLENFIEIVILCC